MYVAVLTPFQLSKYRNVNNCNTYGNTHHKRDLDLGKPSTLEMMRFKILNKPV